MPAAETIADAEALFERGPVRYFEGEKTVKVDLNDLAGDTEYNLYVAVRNINPLVYSDLASEVIDTHVPYTEMITLESVGLTSFSYHIMKPEGVTKYKHVCLSKSDYDYIVSLIGGSLHSYVSAFGAEATEDQTYNFDTTFFDIVDFRQDIYSDMEFIIIAGEVDENGQVAESAVKSLLFKTKKAGVAPYDFDVSVDNIGSMTADITIEPEETGTTFAENALIKAETICKACGLPTIADDSGLCVEALGGAPGVYSARYCGRHGDDEANNDKLLDAMQAVPAGQRGAKFVSAVCFILPDGRHLTCMGECPGSIAFERLCGDYGFGYDPLFIPTDCGVGKHDKRPNTEGRSYAQLTPDEKDAISHRGNALAELEKELPDFLK